MELGLVSFWRNSQFLGEPSNLVLFIVSVVLGLAPFGLLGCTKTDRHLNTKLSRNQPLINSIIFVLFLLGLSWNIPELYRIFQETPVHHKYSDIIPQIDVMVRRFFVEGTDPYEPITEFGYKLQSPYMPLQWGPFVIARSLQFDFRWLAFGAYVISTGFFVQTGLNRTQVVVKKIVIASLPVIFLTAFVIYEKSIFAHTVELLMCGYYLLIATSIIRGPIWLQGVALSLCLLSKFAIVFWVPVFLLSIFFFKSKKHALIVGGIAISAVLFLYALPFLLPDPMVFFKGLSYHSQVCQNAWSNENWFTPSGRPGILDWGLGLGKYFFEYWPGEIANRLQAMLVVEIVGSSLVAVAMLMLYTKVRTLVNFNYYLLSSLKIYLTIFYSMYALPYPYYYMVYLVVSMVIVMVVITHANHKPHQHLTSS